MKHILIVDDNASCLVLARNILQGEYHVNVITSGEQALRFLKRNIPDLVILDLNMPQMSGEETLQRMKLTPGFSSKVLVLSAESEEMTQEMCSKMQADDYLIKPYRPEQLKKAVAMLLE